MEGPPPDKRHIEGLAKGIIEELVRANLTMHQMQIEGWAHTATIPPVNANVPTSVLKGLGKDQYLSLQEAALTIYVKERKLPGFFRRLRLATQILTGKLRLLHQGPYVYEMCESSDPKAYALKLLIEKTEEGKVKATYDVKRNALVEAPLD